MTTERIEDSFKKLEIKTEEAVTSPGTSTNSNSDLPSASTSGDEPEATSKIYAAALPEKGLNKSHEVKPNKAKFIKKKKTLGYDYVPSCHFYSRLEPICEEPQTCKREELRLLFSLIRDNDEINFSKFIWKYPDVLYCAETLPLVEHEGVEYNLLQIAVIFNSPYFCQLILDILEQPHFPKYLFPDEIDQNHSVKMLHIIHLYLNSGSGQAGDTSLHYASKFGFIDCCKILMAHPLCEMTATNNDGLTPSEVIGVNAFENNSRLFPDLEELFNDGLMYVPVFRSESGLEAIVGKPTECKNFNSIELNSGCHPKMEMSERPVYFLKAFAGPMSSKMAKEFYTALERPSLSSFFTPDQQSEISNIKYQEPGRGIERIARSLAADLKIEWKEFFPILDAFTNLSADDGIEVFEKYWDKRKNRSFHCGPFPSLLENVEPLKVCLALLHYYPPTINPLCHRANNLHCYHRKFIQVAAEDLVEDFVPPSSSPLCGRPVEAQSLASDSHNIFMNGNCLSDLDKEIYLAIKNYNAVLYPETHKWKMLMAAELQIDSSYSLESSTKVL